MEQNILVKVSADITSFSRNMQNATRGLDEFRSATSNTFDSFKQVGGAITGAGIALAAGLGYAVMEASTFQSHFAGVRKTVDGSEADFAKLEKGIREMSKELPASANDIADVAASAGQLGIEKDNILAFTRTMIDLGESTNLTAEEAATSFARFANITQMPQTEMDKLGSTVVALGNNLATTEAEIVNMSMRLAAQGTQVGMTQSQIMGLSGAMSSVGINAEAGGTAMSTVLKKMQSDVGKGGKGLKKWAEIAGMSASQFKTAFEKDAAGALNSVVVGLGEAGTEGENMAAILADVGVKGQYESDTMMRLAGAGGLLAESLAIANTGWSENTALSDEAAQRYETLESKFKILKNSIADVARSIGDVLVPYVTTIVEKLTEFANWVGELNPKITTAAAIIATFAAAAALVIGPLLLLIGFIPQIIAGFTAVTTVFTAVKTAFLAFSGPVGIVIALVAALVAAFIYAYQNFESFRNSVNGILSTLAEMFRTAFEAVRTAVMTAFGAVVDFLREKLAVIQQFWAENGAMILEAASVVWNAISNVISTVMNVISSIMQAAWFVIQVVVMTVWDIIKGLISGALNFIMGLVKTFSALLTGNWSAMWEGVKQMFKGALEFIWNFLQLTLLGRMMGAARSFVGLFRGSISSMWAAVRSLFTNALNSIKSFFTSSFNTMRVTAGSVMNAIRSVITSVLNAIRTFFTSTLGNILSAVRSKFAQVVSAIRSKMNEALTAVRQILTNIVTAVKNKASDMISAGKDLILGMINGIKNMTADAIAAVTGVVDGVINKAKSLLKIKSPSRVFREIGEFTGAGLAIGMEREQSAVESAAAGLIAAASASVNPTLDYHASTSGIAAALNGSVGIRDERDNALLGAISGLRRDLTNLRVEMDGQAVGRLTADGVNERNAETAHARRYFG